MRINLEWLREADACIESREEWKSRSMEEIDGIELVQKLMIEDKFRWANWLIVRLMTHEQKIQYAIFAARQVIEIYEKKNPVDNRPRKAIEAAEKYLKNPTAENKNAANAAAYAAANAAANDAYAAAKRKELKIKIINNGMMILKSSKGRKTK